MLRGYCRVSTLKQADEDKTSLSEQAKRIQAAAVLLGEANVAIYADTISGSVPLGERTGGARLLEDLREGDVLVSAKLDRAFRSSEDALTTVKALRARGIKTVMLDISHEPLGEGAVGELILTVMAAVAVFDRRRILERMADGKRGKRARGGHNGGRPRWGERVIGRGRNARVVPVPAELAVIEQVRGMSGSLREIAAALTAQGITTRKGTPLSASQIMRMRQQGVYR